jgi:hypothetical protein
MAFLGVLAAAQAVLAARHLLLGLERRGKVTMAGSILDKVEWGQREAAVALVQ